MRVTFEKLAEISSNKLTYYSVYFGSEQLTEFELFDNKDFPEHLEELQILYNVIQQMSERGARAYYFINESSAEYLPRVPDKIKDANSSDYGIRLYCKRLADNLVVLLNGDVKTKSNPKQCNNVKKHYSRAIKIGLLLDKAIVNRDVDLNAVNPFEDFEIDI